ncbi:MAG: S9 family peptidase [Caulobacterales bacterium]|nr:S9 family peptidase [Caulobacterales bacterium]
MIRRAFLFGSAITLAAGPALARVVTKPVAKRQQGTLTLENVPETPLELREGLRRYQNARSAFFDDWLDDGSMLISTRFGQTSQLHRVTAPGADRHQLTFFDEPIGAVTAVPRSKTSFVFGKDTGGDEYHQFYLAGLTGPEKAFTTAGTRNQSLTFSRDGRRVAWAEVGKGDGNYTLRIADFDAATGPKPGGESIKLTGATSPVAFSPDGRALLLQHYISAAESKLYLWEPGVPLQEINPTTAPVAYQGGAFTADGQSIVVISNQDYEFLRLVEINLQSNRIAPITAGDLTWDVETFALSEDGKLLAYGINEGGRSRVVVRELRGRKTLRQPTLPVGVLTALKFSPDGKSLAIGLNTATSPADIWSWDLKEARLTRWTTSESGGLDPAALVEPAVVKFRSFDGLGVPAWVYRPRASKGRAPVIIDIHGGPESQARPGFNSRIQYWAVELGATVIVPNVRGSDGYGKTYLALDNAEKRQDSVKDIGALLDWIATQPDLDKDRVVVYGGSYGGFMVLASLAAYNDRLAGAIDIVGISNFTTFLTNTEGYRRDLRRAEYGDERTPKMKAVFDRISPLNLAGKMTKPLFVIQGRNDPRVPWTEAEQIVARVRANGGDVWYMLAGDEGHGFKKKQNIDAQREAETLFLRKVFKL